MKTKSKEVIIKDIESYSVYEKNINKEVYYVYKIETNRPLNLDAVQHVITESVKVPEGLDEWMEVNGVGQIEIVEFLNNYFKSE